MHKAIGDPQFIAELSLRAVWGDRIVVGVSELNRDKVVLAIGTDENYYMIECDCGQATRIAAELLTKVDSVMGGAA